MFIGSVVMSLTVAQIITHVNENAPNVWEGSQIAATVAFICDFIVLGIELFRLGCMVEFTPSPSDQWVHDRLSYQHCHRTDT